MIRAATEEDAVAIAAIYNEYILHSCITFETEAVSSEEMKRRMLLIADSYPYLVCEEEGEVVGYCYAHAWKEKEAYRHTAETTIYVHPHKRCTGIGRRLMQALLTACQERGLHVLIACITVPNEASVALHREFGFRQASHFHEVGYKFGQWLDVYDFEFRY